MMGAVGKLSEFFSSSPKRQHHLVEKIKELLPSNNHRILIDVCYTRWISRLDGLDRVVELLHPVLATLEDISLSKSGNGVAGARNWNMKNRDDAQTLTNSTSFEFIVTLVVVQYILGLTKPASLESQKGEMDILTTEQEIPTQKHVLEDMQANVNQHHIQLYQKAVQLARKIAIQPSMPRTAQSQMFRDNCSASSP